MEFFTQQMDFILNSEVHPHRIFCQVAHINYANLQHADPRPQIYLYQSHMYRAVQIGQVAIGASSTRQNHFQAITTDVTFDAIRGNVAEMTFLADIK
jgi:hydroxyethylthiazole kinase-like sugar kinase family protein